MLAATLIVGCGKDANRDSNGGVSGDGSVVAFVPTPEACMRQPSTWNGWGNYQTYGYQSCSWTGANTAWGGSGYGYQNSGWNQPYNMQGSCGCPSGYQPVCDGGLGGMICMPTNGFQYQNQMVYWGWNNNNRFSHYAGYQPTYWNNSYGSPFGQSCMVGTNSCGYGLCQPTAPGSPYGVCIR